MRNSAQFLKEKLGGVLTATGSKIRDIDDAYAKAVRDLLIVEGGKSPVDVGRSMVGAIVGSPLTHGLPEVIQTAELSRGARMAQEAMRYGIPVASAGVRYVAPAAAMTAVGAGVMDILQNQEDRPEQRQQLM